jgi:hypothetical protein
VHTDRDAELAGRVQKLASCEPYFDFSMSGAASTCRALGAQGCPGCGKLIQR